MPMRRNPIRRLGKASRGCTPVPDELIRHGVPEIGCNAFTVLVLLLSHADGWETSAVEMSEQLGWGQNRRRISAALAALIKSGRLVIRDHVREGGGRVCQEYIVHADARRFNDHERDEWSAPVVLSASARGCTKMVQAPCTKSVQGGGE